MCRKLFCPPPAALRVGCKRKMKLEWAERSEHGQASGVCLGHVVRSHVKSPSGFLCFTLCLLMGSRRIKHLRRS